MLMENPRREWEKIYLHIYSRMVVCVRARSALVHHAMLRQKLIENPYVNCMEFRVRERRVHQLWMLPMIDTGCAAYLVHVKCTIYEPDNAQNLTNHNNCDLCALICFDKIYGNKWQGAIVTMGDAGTFDNSPCEIPIKFMHRENATRAYRTHIPMNLSTDFADVDAVLTRFSLWAAVSSTGWKDNREKRWITSEKILKCEPLLRI